MDLEHKVSSRGQVILEGLVMVVLAVRVAPGGWCGMRLSSSGLWSVPLFLIVGKPESGFPVGSFIPAPEHVIGGVSHEETSLFQLRYQSGRGFLLSCPSRC
jgi:hypothetical protein